MTTDEAVEMSRLRPSVRLSAVLSALYARGQRTVSAGQVAELMWPDSRRSNTQGQTMHVGSAVAARMLRHTKGVTEIEHRRWHIWGFGPKEQG